MPLNAVSSGIDLAVVHPQLVFDLCPHSVISRPVLADLSGVELIGLAITAVTAHGGGLPTLALLRVVDIDERDVSGLGVVDHFRSRVT